MTNEQELSIYVNKAKADHKGHGGRGRSQSKIR